MRILVLGSNGLVGQEILQELRRRYLQAELIAPVRRAPTHPVGGCHYITQKSLDFSGQDYSMSVDAIFCALGSTLLNAGSREAFRAIDCELVIEAAQAAQGAGVPRFLVVSATGADSRSSIFYNRVKGEMEDALRFLEFPYLTLARPSLILGDREEFRWGELLARRTLTPLAPIIPAMIRPVHAREIARVLVMDLERSWTGLRIIDNKQIVRQVPPSQ